MRAKNKILLMSTVAFGVLMFSFQNCSQIDVSKIAVTDLAAKVGSSSQQDGAAVGLDEVQIQITESSGEVIDVGSAPISNSDQANSTTTSQSDSKGNPTITNTDSSSSSDSDKSDKDEKELVDVQISEEEDSYEDDSNQQDQIAIDDGAKSSKNRCAKYIADRDSKLIDIADFDAIVSIEVLQGLTVFYSSDESKTHIESLRISSAKGRTILCGIVVDQLDLKKGRLELFDGAIIHNLGESRGSIVMDSSSSIGYEE